MTSFQLTPEFKKVFFGVLLITTLFWVVVIGAVWRIIKAILW